MTYKIAFTDIDGTLLNKERELSLKTIQTIKALPVPFILISSRMPNAMRHLQADLDIEKLPLICYNGGLILVDNKPIHSTEIPMNIHEVLQKLTTKHDFHVSWYHQDEWYVPSMDFWAKREENNTKVTPTVKPHLEVIKDWKNSKKGAHKIMCMGEADQIDKVYAYLEEHHANEIHLYRSKDTYIEIANKEISKLTAIESLLKHSYPDYKLSESVAYGDNYNDMEMLKAVGLGVAVQNAKT